MRSVTSHNSMVLTIKITYSHLLINHSPFLSIALHFSPAFSITSHCSPLLPITLNYSPLFCNPHYLDYPQLLHITLFYSLIPTINHPIFSTTLHFSLLLSTTIRYSPVVFITLTWILSLSITSLLHYFSYLHYSTSINMTHNCSLCFL